MVSPIAQEFTNNLPDFSREIILTLRDLIFSVDSTIIESKKWEFLAFSTKNGLVLGIYPAKEFVTCMFTFGAQMKDTDHLFNYGFDNAKSRSIKFYSVDEVHKNADKIKDYIQEAISNSIEGKIISQKDIAKKEIPIPVNLAEELQANGLLEVFKNMSYTMRKEYIVWIEGAKKEETRMRRLQKIIDMLQEKI